MVSMWTADRIAYRNEDNFVRAYQGSELVWERPVPKNIIYYTTSDNQVINIPSGYYWGNNVNIVSNTYVNGVGTIVFSGDVDTIPASSSGPFRGSTTLTTIRLPESVDYIQSYSFAGCTSLTTINIPGRVGSNLGSYCFYQCSGLQNVTISEGVTSISASTFRECTSLTRVVIPSTVNLLSDACFYNCSSLIEVIMMPINPPTMFGSNIFSRNAEGRLIKVPAGSVQRYKTSSGWSDYASSIVSQ